MDLFTTSSFGFYAQQQLAEFFQSEIWWNLMLLVKGLGALATLVLAGLVIFLIIKNNVVGIKLAPIKTMLHKPAVASKNSELLRRLQKIKQRLVKQDAEEDRLAVLEASQLLERGLALTGHKDASLRKNLEAVPAWVATSISDILAAYNVRIRIVHSPHAAVSHEEAERAVQVMEKALQDLKLI